jgi:hypothetical protein
MKTRWRCVHAISKNTQQHDRIICQKAQEERRAEGEQELEAACQVGDVFIVYSSN